MFLELIESDSVLKFKTAAPLLARPRAANTDYRASRLARITRQCGLLSHGRPPK